MNDSDLQPWLRVFRAGVLLLAVAIIVGGCSSSQSNQLGIELAVDDRNVSEATRTNPVLLGIDGPVEFAISVANPSTEAAVQVGAIRLEGKVLGVRFLHSNTKVDFAIPPGGARDIALGIDLFDIEQQAGGYLDARLMVFDQQGVQVGGEQFPAQVDGRPWSGLSIAFVLVLAFAAASLLVNFTSVAAGRLPRNRIYRGFRFALSGLAVAVAALVAMSLFGLWIPPAQFWVPALLVGIAAGAGLGYLSPARAVDENGDDVEVDLRGSTTARAATSSSASGDAARKSSS